MSKTATPQQKQTLDIAFAKLLNKPAGSTYITGPELRFELTAPDRKQKDELIQACVAAQFLKQESEEKLFFTTEGLFALTDPRPVKIIQATLDLLKKKYTESKGSRVVYFKWSELHEQGKFHSSVDYQDITWHTLDISMIATGWHNSNGKLGTEDFEGTLGVVLKESEQENLNETGWSVQAFREYRQPVNASITSFETITNKSISKNDINLNNVEQQIEEENQDNQDNQLTIQINPTNINFDTRTLTINHIINRIKENELDLSPDFQRNDVWKLSTKSRLIESLLLRK